ncbi:MAG: hypothetical protein ABWW69_03340, partial [Pyrodictiaceae archaeon]
MRGVSNLVSAVILLSALLVAGVSLAALIEKEYNIARYESLKTLILSKPVKASLVVDDNNGCDDGVLDVKLFLPEKGLSNILLVSEDGNIMKKIVLENTNAMI